MATALVQATLDTAQATPIREIPREPSFDGLYVFDGLGRSVVAASHGLHKYPAKFVPQIPRWALTHRALAPESVVLDPFAGSGTTVLEAALHGHLGIGVDINPLAEYITRAKTTLIPADFDALDVSLTLVADARQRVRALAAALVPNEASLGMHRTWSNWFAPSAIADLLALRDAIADRYAEQPDVRVFLMACLSSIAKSCSLLDENQIKVRRVPDKRVAEPFDAFSVVVQRAVEVQAPLRHRLSAAPAPKVIVGSATALPLHAESVDRIITSPPYINAVDYTMTHKYNLFLLGLIEPALFKRHCRSYIGMTERAVRAVDLEAMPIVGHGAADREVRALWLLGTPVARNRAFVVAQFFIGMAKAFDEMKRVLRPGGLVVSVIGNENFICARRVKTAAVCEQLAESAGLTVQLRFEHQIANVSSMRLSRNAAGGKVATEAIHVLRRD
jgi:DNA modification methylase